MPPSANWIVINNTALLMQDTSSQTMAKALSNEEATLPLLPVSIALPLDMVR